MKTKVKTFIDKVPKNVILCTITCLLISSVANLYTLKVENDSINKIKTSISCKGTELKESYLTTFMELGYKLSKQTTDLLAKKLENAIISNYDLNTLKTEFENGELSDDFYSIIKGALSVNMGENELFSTEKITMVAVKDGLIAEFSNTDKHLICEGKLLPWEEYINNSINPHLTKDALNIALSGVDKIAFIQKDGDVVITKSNIKDLISLYMKEGRSVLEDYYFITASFITEEGDIFGTDDKTFLSSNDNYKIIVLNSTKVSDVIQFFESVVNKIDNNNNELLTHLYGYTTLRKVGSILCSGIIFLSAIGMVILYNKKVG